MVEALPAELKSSNGSKVTITGATLTTCCKKAWKQLKETVRHMKKEPELIILTGLATDHNCITLERFAVNISDYRMSDNHGHWLKDKPIDHAGPDGIKCRLPLTKLEEHLAGIGIACDVSNHAGAFLCNEIYYRCLNRWPDKANILFVHLPPSGTKAPDGSVLTVDTYVSAIIEIIQFCAAHNEIRSAK